MKMVIIVSTIYITSLLVRIFHLILDPLLQRDAALYLSLAEKWYESGDYIKTIEKEIIMPPLPLYTITKMMELGLGTEIAGRSLSLFWGSMLPVLGYIIASTIFKRMIVSKITVLLLIFHPTLISYSIQPLRENYYLCFVGIALLATIKLVIQNRIRDGILCGVFLSLAVYSRYESLEFLLFLPMILLLLVLWKRIQVRKATSLLVSFLISFFLTCSFLLKITNCNLLFIKKINQYFIKWFIS